MSIAVPLAAVGMTISFLSSAPAKWYALAPMTAWFFGGLLIGRTVTEAPN